VDVLVISYKAREKRGLEVTRMYDRDMIPFERARG
jgi:hypothetical protein